jgi:hypothetical protein
MSRQTWLIIIGLAVIFGVIYMYESKLSKAKETVTAAVTSGSDNTGNGSTPAPTPDEGGNPVSRLNTNR